MMTFSQKVFAKRGMKAFSVPSSACLPGANEFARFANCHACPKPCGLGAFQVPGTAPLPGPDVFNLFAKRAGMRAFNARMGRPVLPGKNVFRGLSRFPRRGMGDDSAYQVDVMGSPYTVPTYETSDPLLSQGITVSSLPTLPTSSWQPGGSTLIGATSNPALDAFNQALTNAQANNSSLLNPSTLANLSNAVAAASPTQLSQATATLLGSPSSSGVSGALGSLGTWASQNMSLLLIGGGGLLALTLIAGGKKRR